MRRAMVLVLFAGLWACSEDPVDDLGLGDAGADVGPSDLGFADLGLDAASRDAEPQDAPIEDLVPISDLGFPEDTGPRDTGDFDSGILDAGCTPSGAEICDQLDNDCDGLVDNVDSAGDGIYDCLRIALFGNPGSLGSSNFLAWLQSNGVTVDRIQTDTATLTPSLLASYDVIILDRLVREYDAGEATLLRGWVEGGGGLMALTGYTGGDADRTRPNGLMAELGLEYLPGLRSGPVTMWLPHATTSSLSSITFSGGFIVAENGAARTSTTTVIATLADGPAAIVAERGRGRVYVWGDEWVTFDSEWQQLPQVPIFWANALGWLAHFR